MQRIKANFQNVDRAVEFLRKGGVLIHPTDTCYGMAADITNQNAVEKIHLLKQMSLHKPMSILVSDTSMLKQYGKTNQKIDDIVKKYLPGALTLIIPKTQNVPQHYAEGKSSIGIRIPDDSLSLEICKRLGKPLTTTSANLTGQIQAYSSDEVANYFEDQDVLFFDGGLLKKQKPSTIIKVKEDGFEIIRQGDLFIHNLDENIT